MRIRRLAFVLSVALFSLTISVHGQGFSLNDTTILFKNKEGKILTKEEINEIVKSAFSIGKGVDSNGRKIIYLIPMSREALSKEEERKIAFKKSLEGRKMPFFILNDIAGKSYTLNSLKGKVIVLNFWFIQCEPCKREIPFLNSLVKNYEGKQVVFLAPSTNNIKELKEFLKQTKFNYTVNIANQKLIDDLKIAGFPVDIIVNKKGIITKVIEGNNDRKTESELSAAIKTALKM